MRFEDILREHNVPYWREGKYARQGWIQFHCPFCFGRSNPEKPYGGYNISGNYINCWACGPHRLIDTVMKLTGMSFREVKGIIDDLEPEEIREAKKRAGKLKLPSNLGPLLKCHGNYLRSRGFDTKELKKLWKLQGLGFDGKRMESDRYDLAWRIFIPVISRGETVSWTTRSLDNHGTRYLSAGIEEEAICHKDLLYGEDYATTAISIHEGPADVWAVGPSATATLGIGFTPAQLLRMSRYPKRVVCFDNEPAAQKRARMLCSLLEVFDGETFNVRLDAKDAASATRGEIRKFRRFLNK